MAGIPSSKAILRGSWTKWRSIPRCCLSPMSRHTIPRESPSSPSPPSTPWPSPVWPVGVTPCIAAASGPDARHRPQRHHEGSRSPSRACSPRSLTSRLSSPPARERLASFSNRLTAAARGNTHRPDQPTGTDRKPIGVTPWSCRPQWQPRGRPDGGHRAAEPLGGGAFSFAEGRVGSPVYRPL